MSVLQKLKSTLPGVDAGASVRSYECQDCGNVFESAKTPEKAKCMDCLSTDVEPKQ